MVSAMISTDKWFGKFQKLAKHWERVWSFHVADVVERQFVRYGEFVSLHPWPFIVVPLVVTVLLSFGIARITINDDLRFLYTQGNSPSLNEYALHRTFRNLTDQPTSLVSLIIVAKDKSNLLRKDSNFSTYVSTINSYILHNMTVDGRNFGARYCRPYAYCNNSNHATRYFLNAYFDPKLRNMSSIKLTYPIMTVYDSKVFLAANFYGVNMDESGRVLEAHVLCLNFNYRLASDEDDDKTQNAVETGMQTYMERVFDANSSYDFSLYSLNLLKTEISKNTWCTLVYLPLSVALLLCFTLFTTCTGDCVTSKPVEGLLGVFTSVLAILSASGLLIFFGVPYNSTVSVMPFLTLALAVDDTYIMLAAWHHTDKTCSVSRRMGLTLKESGTAITVTALTDVFSFAIGAFSSTPAISAFCQFTALAVAFDYVYQLSFFCAIAALGGHREKNGMHCLLFWLPANSTILARWRTMLPCTGSASIVAAKSDSKQFNLDSKRSSLDPKSHMAHASRMNPFERGFKFYYTRLLAKGAFQVAVLIFYALYLCFVFYGCVIIKVNLTPSKVLMSDSTLNRPIQLAENYIWKQGLVGLVYVMHAPDFRVPSARQRFVDFVRKLESTSYSMGANSTLLWYREYMEHLRYFKSSDEQFYNSLRNFCKLSVNQQWAEQLRWTSEEEAGVVDRFYFTTAFRIEDWVDRTKMVKLWRQLCQLYPEYQAFVYDENNFYADQINSLAPNTIQDCGIAFLCMALVCALFISHRIVLFWVLWSLFSMNLAVIGSLAWWGCDLDPLAVTSILLSIGLTVDFTAHVGYHFSRSSGAGRYEKLRETLTVAGWPLIQGAMSTFLAISSLVFVRSYSVQVFFRTVLLVISSGLLHALLFLPVLFMCTVHDDRRSRTKVK